MSQVLAPARTFGEAISELGGRLSDPVRQAAFGRFQALGVPNQKVEEWKYTSLRLLSEASFEVEGGSSWSAADLAALPGLTSANRIVFGDGRFLPELSSETLPQGVRFRRLAEESPAELGQIATQRGKLGTTNDERFLDLNTGLNADGAWLEIEPNTVLDEPIQFIFLTSPRRLSFPRLFVRAGSGSQAAITEYHAGKGDSATFPVAEFEIEKNAILDHVRIQLDSLDAFHIGVLAARQAADSTYTNTNVQFGARIGRLDANVWVGGEHAETWLNGAYVGRGEQHLDNHTRIDHAVPNCHSFEVYKGIMADRANGVFNGKIFVYPDAQKTDAKQTNQALLLSPTAAIDTKPQLEIFADDVKCTHGATVGQLREDAMFYLRSRGIPENEARNILVYAFVAEVLEKVSYVPLRDALEAALFWKLGTNSE